MVRQPLAVGAAEFRHDFVYRGEQHKKSDAKDEAATTRSPAIEITNLGGADISFVPSYV